MSIVQPKVVTPNDFTSLDQVEDRLIAFERRYNETARPFRWKFTPADLEDLLARIERHEQKERNSQQPIDCEHQPAGLPQPRNPREVYGDDHLGGALRVAGADLTLSEQAPPGPPITPGCTRPGRGTTRSPASPAPSTGQGFGVVALKDVMSGSRAVHLQPSAQDAPMLSPEMGEDDPHQAIPAAPGGGVGHPCGSTNSGAQEQIKACRLRGKGSPEPGGRGVI
ncbi:hypothetical protein OHA25_07730 [Nonomuraea sp. NBC_00507]|uniref:hypothetical protein n=1 Tax=Nonomuraea sp. NBC_00507 TaxID=2976002 RepID=UPI002E19F6E5